MHFYKIPYQMNKKWIFQKKTKDQILATRFKNTPPIPEIQKQNPNA